MIFLASYMYWCFFYVTYTVFDLAFTLELHSLILIRDINIVYYDTNIIYSIVQSFSLISEFNYEKRDLGFDMMKSLPNFIITFNSIL